MIDLNLCGKTAFITGGSRGIGKSVSDIFLKAGANVISPTRSELDLSDLNSVDNYLSNLDVSVDVFVHVAGVNRLAGIDEVTDDIISEVFNVNYYSTLKLIQHFSKGMKHNRYGRIVLVSSIYALVSRERRIVYSSSKNALTGLMKSLAIELGEYNILVNCVAPGYVLTDMTLQNLSEEEISELEKRIPTKRLQSVEDIANTCLFLSSDLNNSITGQLLAVDGGFTLI